MNKICAVLITLASVSTPAFSAELVGGGVACRSVTDLHDFSAYADASDTDSYIALLRQQRCRYPLCEGEQATMLRRNRADDTVQYGQKAEKWWTYEEMIRE